jgi:hypothetical protein
MLSMLSWSKDPSWRREEKEGKRHHRMNWRYHRCIASEYLVHRTTTGVNLIPSVSDGLFPSCVRWIGEEKPRRQQCRMNRRSNGGNRRSIRWSSLNKTETCQDQRSSTGWTDVSVAVHLMVTWKLIVRFWPWGLQHWMIRRCVRAVLSENPNS